MMCLCLPPAPLLPESRAACAQDVDDFYSIHRRRLWYRQLCCYAQRVCYVQSILCVFVSGVTPCGDYTIGSLLSGIEREPSATPKGLHINKKYSMWADRSPSQSRITLTFWIYTSCDFHSSSTMMEWNRRSGKCIAPEPSPISASPPIMCGVYIS